MFDKILKRLKAEPALVRTVVWGGLGIAAARWHLDDIQWWEGVITLVLLTGAGLDIRRKVEPTEDE